MTTVILEKSLQAVATLTLPYNNNNKQLKNIKLQQTFRIRMTMLKKSICDDLKFVWSFTIKAALWWRRQWKIDILMFAINFNVAKVNLFPLSICINIKHNNNSNSNIRYTIRYVLLTGSDTLRETIQISLDGRKFLFDENSHITNYKTEPLEKDLEDICSTVVKDWYKR
jgi:hypothetical protein